MNSPNQILDKMMRTKIELRLMSHIKFILFRLILLRNQGTCYYQDKTFHRYSDFIQRIKYILFYFFVCVISAENQDDSKTYTHNADCRTWTRKGRFCKWKMALVWNLRYICDLKRLYKMYVSSFRNKCNLHRIPKQT